MSIISRVCIPCAVLLFAQLHAKELVHVSQLKEQEARISWQEVPGAVSYRVLIRNAHGRIVTNAVATTRSYSFFPTQTGVVPIPDYCLRRVASRVCKRVDQLIH